MSESKHDWPCPFTFEKDGGFGLCMGEPCPLYTDRTLNTPLGQKVEDMCGLKALICDSITAIQLAVPANNVAQMQLQQLGRKILPASN